MTEVGQEAIDRAKADGSWSQFDEVDALIVPPDLKTALDGSPGAMASYEALTDSAKKQHLWWIHSAKRPTTRGDRIEKIIRGLTAGTSRSSD